MAGISVWILMYAVAANLSVWFFSSALLLYRQFILQSSNTLRLVTAQEIKQFRIKLEQLCRKAQTTGQYPQKQRLATQKMHTFRSRHRRSLRGLPSQTAASLWSHQGSMRSISKFIASDFIERQNCSMFPGLQNLPQMHTTQIAINASSSAWALR